MTNPTTPQAADHSPVSNTNGIHVISDTVQIENLDQFVKILTAWHNDKVKTCQHLLAVPEGAVFQVGESSIELNGQTLVGFKFGIEMALIQLGVLPFAVELEDAAT